MTPQYLVRDAKGRTSHVDTAVQGQTYAEGWNKAYPQSAPYVVIERTTSDRVVWPEVEVQHICGHCGTEDTKPCENPDCQTPVFNFTPVGPATPPSEQRYVLVDKNDRIQSVSALMTRDGADTAIAWHRKLSPSEAPFRIYPLGPEVVPEPRRVSVKGYDCWYVAGHLPWKGERVHITDGVTAGRVKSASCHSLPSLLDCFGITPSASEYAELIALKPTLDDGEENGE